eukprot:scaffold9431_cov19-Tisochrysis_lutea.AAC.2
MAKGILPAGLSALRCCCKAHSNEKGVTHGLSDEPTLHMTPLMRHASLPICVCSRKGVMTRMGGAYRASWAWMKGKQQAIFKIVAFLSFPSSRFRKGHRVHQCKGSQLASCCKLLQKVAPNRGSADSFVCIHMRAQLEAALAKLEGTVAVAQADAEAAMAKAAAEAKARREAEEWAKEAAEVALREKEAQ